MRPLFASALLLLLAGSPHLAPVAAESRLTTVLREAGDQLTQRPPEDCNALARLVVVGAEPATNDGTEGNSDETQVATLEETLVHLQREFTPVGDERVARAAQRLDMTLRRMEHWVSLICPQVVRQWNDYLRLPELRRELAAGREANLQVAQESLSQFASGATKLEHEPVRDARAALRDWIYLLRLSREEGLAERYERELAALQDAMAGYRERPNSEQAHQIGRIAEFLERLGAGREALAEVRRSFGRPNLFGYASGRFLGAGMSEPVYDVSTIRDNILGTNIVATGTTRGQVSTVLVPDPHHASFDLRLWATTHARSVGKNRNVVIYSNSVSNTQAGKRVVFDEYGVRSYPAWARVSTSTTITGIQAGMRLIEHIARKRANQQLPQAQAIASRRQEGRVAARMEQRAAPLVADANRRYHEQFRSFLMRRDALPQMMAFSTGHDAIYLTGLQAQTGQMGAPSAPAVGVPAGHDLAVQAHQSAMNNLAQSFIGGMTLTDERLAELMKETTGEVPEELRITADKDPWTITFDDGMPLAVDVDGGEVRITLRGSRFTRSNTAINAPTVIRADYTIERTPQGARLVRKGDAVSVDFVPPRTGVRATVDRTFLRSKFDALFKPEITTTGLQLPGRWQHVGPLKLVRLEARGGWLVLAWNIGGSPVQAE